MLRTSSPPNSGVRAARLFSVKGIFGFSDHLPLCGQGSPGQCLNKRVQAKAFWIKMLFSKTGCGLCGPRLQSADGP